MKVLMVNGSARAEGNTFVALTEVAKRVAEHGVESEIVQDDLCNRIADNMAWLLNKIHSGDGLDYPEREPWNPMNFIR